MFTKLARKAIINSKTMEVSDEFFNINSMILIGKLKMEKRFET